MLFNFICESCNDIFNAIFAKEESKYTLICQTVTDKGFRFVAASQLFHILKHKCITILSSFCC